VPKETRRALLGGATTFERILPGPDRMYPDTDSPPTRVTPERVAAIRARLAPPPWERERQYGSWGVPRETTHFLIRRGGATLVDEVVRRTGVDGRTAAIEIGQRGKALTRAGLPIERLTPEAWLGVFDLYGRGVIAREGIRAVVGALARDPGQTADAAATALGLRLDEPRSWQRTLDGLGLEDYRGPRDDRAPLLRFAVGKATRMLAGRASAKDVVAYLEARLSEMAA
jgi:glutamyl-tRNA(Gln) amidotransferase subunit E